jgi:hypothetical protein
MQESSQESFAGPAIVRLICVCFGRGRRHARARKKKFKATFFLFFTIQNALVLLCRPAAARQGDVRQR